MILDVAETLNPLLDRRKERFEAGLEDDEDVSDTTLQLVFFDGEEAFRDWTKTDSVYGARFALFSIHLYDTHRPGFIQASCREMGNNLHFTSY